MVNKKRKYRKAACWLLVDLAIASIIFALLLYKPSSYIPPEISPDGQKQGRVHPYLTHLSSELYNEAQRDEPFELVVIEERINEIIGRSKWPKVSEGVTFSEPVVLFVPESIILMGTANIKGADFIVTIVLQPSVNQQGLLNLQMTKIKIGAMNITPLARIVAKRMYQNRIATIPIDIESLQTKIAASLLNNEPFDPIFPVPGTRVRVRVEKVTVTKGKLILRLVPIHSLVRVEE